MTVCVRSAVWAFVLRGSLAFSLGACGPIAAPSSSGSASLGSAPPNSASPSSAGAATASSSSAALGASGEASNCAEALAYRPEGRAEQWIALSGSALTVTGDLVLAPSLAQFQYFRPAGLRFLGNQALGPSAAALMGGSCAAVFHLVVDPAPTAGEARLCEGTEAGALAARLSNDGERLSVTVYPAGVEPAAGAEPCQSYRYARLGLNSASSPSGEAGGSPAP